MRDEEIHSSFFFFKIINCRGFIASPTFNNPKNTSNSPSHALKDASDTSGTPKYTSEDVYLYVRHPVGYVPIRQNIRPVTYPTRPATYIYTS